MYDSAILCMLIFIAAVLYSSVGHAGASGYLAAMALMGIAPEVMRPAALVMNIFVATIGTIRFYRAGYFSWSLFLQLATGSIPLALLGGYLTLPHRAYKQIVGVILLLTAIRLLASLWRAAAMEPAEKHANPIVAVGCGAGIGLLAGLTGTGGGIFMTPLLLFMNWAQTKKAAAVSVAFILVNSIAGLAGHWAKVQTMPAHVGYWVVAAVLGGLIGSELGSQRLGHPVLKFLLGIVLMIAAGKLLTVR